ncbi:hypothetical protein F2Q68_00002588 [Brassica cretica]|nr:hypothetical protein F2Q68_00002588 [Brassica cretica]
MANDHTDDLDELLDSALDDFKDLNLAQRLLLLSLLPLFLAQKSQTLCLSFGYE